MMTIQKLLDSGELTRSPVTQEPQRTVTCEDDSGQIHKITVIGMQAHLWGYRVGSVLLVHPCDEPELGEGQFSRNVVLIGYGWAN